MGLTSSMLLGNDVLQQLGGGHLLVYSSSHLGMLPPLWTVVHSVLVTHMLWCFCLCLVTRSVSQT